MGAAPVFIKSGIVIIQFMGGTSKVKKIKILESIADLKSVQVYRKIYKQIVKSLTG